MSALPGGTVTFLFSDIEGSTRLLEQLGDRYQEVDRDHRRILRERLSEAGGQEMTTRVTRSSSPSRARRTLS